MQFQSSRDTAEYTRGGVVREQLCGDNCVFQFGVEIFSMKLFAQFGALPAPFAAPVERVPPLLWRANLGLAPFFISDELLLLKIWVYQAFIQLIVHKEPSVGGVEGLMAPHRKKLEVCQNFPLTQSSLPKLSPDEPPPLIAEGSKARGQ